jgi:F-type H+-transporting ATPase subunit a
MGLHISLAAEKIGSLWGMPLTNSLLMTWITMACLFVFAWMATRRMSMIPSGMQNFAETIVGGLYNFFQEVTGHNTRKFFPLIASLFFFVIIANWIGLFPGVGTIGFHHDVVNHEATANTTEAAHAEEVAYSEVAAVVDTHAEETDEHQTAVTQVTTTEAVAGEEEHHTVFTPLFRAATADLNLTFALAIVAVLAIQVYGLAALGRGYVSKFFNFSSPMAFGLGILEFISEVSRIISFAFRLFGNIFAGEVLLAVMAFLLPFIVPLPFLVMEVFVGFIQALVFSMLTAVFLNMAVTAHEEGH